MKPWLSAPSVFVAVAAFVAVVGCKKPKPVAVEGSDTKLKTVTAESLCQSVFGASLYFHDPKCSDAENAAEETTYGGMLRSQIANCKTELEASVARSRVKLDPAGGATCISAIRDGQLRHDRVEHWKSKVCDGAINGIQAKGAPCRQTWECAAPLACVGFTKDKDGACDDPPVAKDAHCGIVQEDSKRYDLIIGTRKECGKGFYCFVGDCSPQVALGGMCSADRMCAEGLACRAGLCAKPDRLPAGATQPKPAGTPCGDDDDCKGRCKNDVCVSWCKSG